MIKNYFKVQLTAEVRVLVFPIWTRPVSIARQLPFYTASSEVTGELLLGITVHLGCCGGK